MIQIPTDAISTSNNCPKLVKNMALAFNVDLSSLFNLIQNLIQIGVHYVLFDFLDCMSAYAVLSVRSFDSM